MRTVAFIVFTVLIISCSIASAEISAKKGFGGVVEIYVTEWCGYCRKAQEYMKSKGIAFKAYDIEKDSAAEQRYRQYGGQGVPLIMVGPNRVSGFSVDRFESFLNSSR